MNIKVFPYGSTISIKLEEFVFPDGQPHIRLLEAPGSGLFNVYARLTCANDLIRLMELNEILSRNKSNKLKLTIMYLMGARMDRAIDYSSPFTLKTICDIIKLGNWHWISIFDPHSDVATALLDASVVYPNYNIAIDDFKPDLLIAPDAGAAKKVQEASKAGSIPMVQCLKERDMQSGALSNFRVCASLETIFGKRCLILDDLCDGGGTFVGLAAKLKDKGASAVGLYVSHGIFSKGSNLAGIDHIYTTNSYQDLEVIPGYRDIHFIY